MKPLKVLIACEESQEVCKAFRREGHKAFSCDTQPCSGGHPEWHIRDDALNPLWDDEWDLVISHPPCTYLSNSGIKHLVRKDRTDGFEYHRNIDRYINWDRYEKLKEACKFFRQFMLYGKLGNRIAIENTIIHKYAADLIGRRQDQVIQPWQFGHGETKATCLWLYGLPELAPTEEVDGREQRIWKMPPGDERSKQRSKTYPGIAEAMTKQWSRAIIEESKEPSQLLMFTQNQIK